MTQTEQALTQEEQLQMMRTANARLDSVTVMIDAGGKEWQKSGLHRVYFGGEEIARLAGGASARDIRDLNKGHYWYEVRKGDFLFTGDRSVHCRRTWGRAVEVLKGKIADSGMKI